jgi:hypothetical protein
MMPKQEDRFWFAKRTIEIFEQTEGCKECKIVKIYDYTSIVGAVLNVLTIIYPKHGKNLHREFDKGLDFLLQRQDALPGFLEFRRYREEPNNIGLRRNGTRRDIIDYIRNIRHALAHKTQDNFDVPSVPENESIPYVLIQSDITRNDRNKPPLQLEFTRKELRTFWGLLKGAIDSCDSSPVSGGATP